MAVSLEPKRMEKSTDTEEDNIAAPLFSSKTTQFPSVQADLSPEPEDASEALRGPSKPTSPKNATPPPSPLPAAVTSEFAYVPADPALQKPLIPQARKRSSHPGLVVPPGSPRYMSWLCHAIMTLCASLHQSYLQPSSISLRPFLQPVS